MNGYARVSPSPRSPTAPSKVPLLPSSNMEVDLHALRSRRMTELTELAHQLRVERASTMGRAELVFEISKLQAGSGQVRGQGVLEVLPDGFGFLRAPEENYAPGADDIYVSPSQIRRFSLRTGDVVSGQVRAPHDNERYFALIKVEEINGAQPGKETPRAFAHLTPVHPDQAITLEHDPSEPISRMLDLYAPIGRGQRVLLSAPPRAGRTTILYKVAKGALQNHSDLHLMALWIGARPEEVTKARREMQGEIIATTFDEPALRHVQTAEMTLERAYRLVEQGKDVLWLVDDLTALARAYNEVESPSGRTLDGGLDPAALLGVKKLLGAARKIEEGGSLTIIAATSLRGNSPFEASIHEELGSTANAHWIIDGNLAAHGIRPAFDLLASSTSNLEILLGEAPAQHRMQLRSRLQGKPENDISATTSLLQKHDSNETLLDSVG